MNMLLNAEMRCFEKLQEAIPGFGGYIGLWPRKTDKVDENAPDQLEEWYFALTGGGDNRLPMTNPSETRTSFAVSAEVKGRFADRKRALLFAGTLLDALPTKAENIQHIGAIEDAVPVITPELFEVGDTGREISGWLVELDMLVVMNKVNELDLW